MLEGKDRIAQHLLTIHSLEDTLSLILEVMADVTGFEKLAIYLQENDELKTAAAIGLTEPGKLADQGQILQLVSDGHSQALAQVRSSREPVDVESEDGTGILVPIVRGEEVLGIIEALDHSSEDKVSSGTTQSLVSFALQAAVAI